LFFKPLLHLFETLLIKGIGIVVKGIGIVVKGIGEDRVVERLRRLGGPGSYPVV
jgi:predicted peroxiredoxin